MTDFVAYSTETTCWANTQTTPKDDPRARYVNEPGLYCLIGSSDMEKAQEFQDWIYEVVLPTIRKTGKFSLMPDAEAQPTPDAEPSLVEWSAKRETVKQLTKAKSNAIKEVTGGKAKAAAYGIVNDALTRGVAGKTPSELKRLHGFIGKKTPRDHMPEVMIGMLSYSEQAVHTELWKKHRELGRDLTQEEALEIAKAVTDTTYTYCQATKGFEMPLLEISPKELVKALMVKAPPAKKQKLLQAERPKAIECAA